METRYWCGRARPAVQDHERAAGLARLEIPDDLVPRLIGLVAESEVDGALCHCVSVRRR